jgi:quinol monooxygenase YgiN
MLTERLTFRAKYGHGDELTGLFREWFKKMAKQAGMTSARLYTDATGPMFTVVAESDFADMAAYAAFFAQDQSMYADPEFQGWFAKMAEATESGDRQLFNMDQLI